MTFTQAAINAEADKAGAAGNSDLMAKLKSAATNKKIQGAFMDVKNNGVSAAMKWMWQIKRPPTPTNPDNKFVVLLYQYPAVRDLQVKNVAYDCRAEQGRSLVPDLKRVAIISMPNVTIKGWEPEDPDWTNAFVLFAKLARPRIKALYPERADDNVDEIISEFWDGLSESKRAKVADPHDGTTYGQLLVSNLIKVMKICRRRICDACGRQRPVEEDRFPVCWCGARRY